MAVHSTQDPPERQLEQLQMLSQNGAALNALRGMIALTKRLRPGFDPSPLRHDVYHLLAQMRGNDALQHSRARVRLTRDLETLQVWGPDFIPLIAEIQDRLKGASPQARSSSEVPDQIIALVELVGHQIGLAVPWAYMPKKSDADPGAVSLDYDGELQERAARHIMLALTDAVESRIAKEFHENHHIVPMEEISGLRLIEGASTGLPTLLAMLQERFNLVPAVGTAASGVIDLSKIRTSPQPGFVEAFYDQFLRVRITHIAAVREKVYAALDQRPSVKRILLPLDNEHDVTNDPELCADLQASGVTIRYIDQVADIFKDPPLFAQAIYAPRLRLDPRYSGRDAEAIERGTKILAATCTAVFVEFALLFAYGYWVLAK